MDSNNKALVSLICGIASVVFIWFGYSAFLSIVFGIAAIITGSAARKELPSSETGMATAGFVLGIIGLVLGAFMLVACVLCVGLFSTSLRFLY